MKNGYGGTLVFERFRHSLNWISRMGLRGVDQSNVILWVSSDTLWSCVITHLKWCSSHVGNAFATADTRNLLSFRNTLLAFRHLTYALTSHTIVSVWWKHQEVTRVRYHIVICWKHIWIGNEQQERWRANFEKTADFDAVGCAFRANEWFSESRWGALLPERVDD